MIETIPTRGSGNWLTLYLFSDRFSTDPLLHVYFVRHFEQGEMWLPKSKLGKLSRFAFSPIVPLEQYPGPRGFLLFFIGKFCDANRFLDFFIGTKRWEPRKESFLFLPTRRVDQRFTTQISKWKKIILKESLWDQGTRTTLATTVIKGIDRSIEWHRPLKMASTVLQRPSREEIGEESSWNFTRGFTVRKIPREMRGKKWRLRRKISLARESRRLRRLITFDIFLYVCVGR